MPKVLLSYDDLINLLIVHKEFPNRTVTCSICTEVGRQAKAKTFFGHMEEPTNERPQTLQEIHNRRVTCSTDAEMRRKAKTDLQNWTETRNTCMHMCRKMKTGLKEELINEFPETLNDELNEQPMRSGEPITFTCKMGHDPARQLYRDKLPRDSSTPQTLP